MDYQLVITCEHAGNQVPHEYRSLFSSHKQLLETHRGYDIGALELASEMAQAFNVQLISGTMTRLLVELNRSIGNRQLFSEISQNLSDTEKKEILKKYYIPYRTQVEKCILKAISEKKQVIHISVHTFTPSLGENIRKADIGWLYDSRLQNEKSFCRKWRYFMALEYPFGVFRFNYPYSGRADGLTTHLRSLYTQEKYLGIEIEVNQKFPLNSHSEWNKIKKGIIHSLENSLTLLKGA